MKNALKELEKKVVENNNMSHVKRLLEITMSVRRQWIEKESSRIVEIVSKYPPLTYYEMVRYLRYTIMFFYISLIVGESLLCSSYLS